MNTREFQLKNIQDLEVLTQELCVNLEFGLSQEEVFKKREEYGENVIPEPRKSFWTLYIAPFLKNGLIILYLVAGVLILLLSIYLQIPDFSSFTFLLVFINAILAIFSIFGS